MVKATTQSFLDTALHYRAEATKMSIRLLRLGEEQGDIQSLLSFKIHYAASKQRQPMEESSVLRVVDALEDILKEDTHNPYARAVITILNTVERALSGAQLHTSEVNYREKLITKERKFDQIKKIPMSDYAVSFLRTIHPNGGANTEPTRRTDSSDYYFPNRRGPIRAERNELAIENQRSVETGFEISLKYAEDPNRTSNRCFGL